MTSTGSPAAGGRVPPAAPPHRVRVPVNIHHWVGISFLHWPIPPERLTRLLPEELAPVTWNGAAWIGVTPFLIRVRPPGIPFVPPGWSFPETNVRTYVTGPDGRQGLWFLHMEVTALWFTAVLRVIGLPYVVRRMSVGVDGERLVYRSSPGRAAMSGGGHHIVVRSGQPLWPLGGGPFERFLTARWGAYHRRGPLLLHTPVEHPPWPLRTAHVETCEVDGLFRAAGLPAPDQPPVCHHSSGVVVKVGRPRLVS